ncbi:MAG: carbohydrate kinase [Alphaproteobacteria bacterium]|nr:carbohydrate kinase [Alphaproteobacteria bacterium]MDE2041494.1 carbohydrate kinase [Alphaproteobacteria bacterium]MDE2339509.1 carbohydrate kinase [Alphaproteobacteria bacterium]
MSKITLWSREGHLVDRRVRPNASVVEADIPRLDTQGIADWARTVLAGYAAHPIAYIIPVGHGAGVAALQNGKIAFTPFDYEAEPPASLLLDYRNQRAPFAETGSPPLPGGLNLAAQLHWMTHVYPDRIKNTVLLPWAQYWAWWLSGAAVSEVTSLGCHSDLWAPENADWSKLAYARGWAGRFAPLAKAGDVIGTLRPELAEETGLSTSIKILAGLHDSNAALMAARGFAEIAHNEATVISTGTWFIAMRLPAHPVRMSDLPEGRDCLVNVDAYGAPVPSARFMGGREIEALIEIDTRRVDIRPDQPHLLAAVADVIARQAMFLPTLAPGCGPFPHGAGHWLNPPEDWFQRRAAACLYAALVTDAALDLIGSTERMLIEGRFADAEVIVRALASLRPNTRVYIANAHNDVSFGALRLIDTALVPEGGLRQVEPLAQHLSTYRARWRAAMETPE